jgi:hypothetical protein
MDIVNIYKPKDKKNSKPENPIPSPDIIPVSP